MPIGTFEIGLSGKSGLIFILNLAFYLFIMLFFWYLLSLLTCKSNPERKKIDKIAIILMLLIIFGSILEVIVVALFFPNMDLTWKQEYFGLLAFWIIMLIGAIIIDRVKLKHLRNK